LDLDNLRKTDAIIRTVYHIDPSTLSDKEYGKLVADYAFVKRFESEINKVNFQSALVDVINQLFPDKTNTF